MLTVSLLGPPTFVLNNQPISHLVTGRAAAILIYLAVTRQPQPRAQLTDLLWENVSEHQAKANLRYRLSDLRKVVGDYVIASGETVAFNQQLPHWLDVTAFTTYLAATTPLSAPTVEPAILQELLKLYADEFLTGFAVEKAPIFERWLLTQRRHLQDLLVQGLHLRIEQHLTQGDYAAGLALNHDLLTLEPWREEAHRQRMLLLAHSGQRDAALQQYSRCCAALAEELDVPPMPQTTALYEAIKAGQWGGAHQTNNYNQPVPVIHTAHGTGATHQQNRVASVVANPPSASARVETAPRFDLGAMPEAAHFCGWQAELAALHSWIGQEGSRLVGVLGPSGQGKTALAAAFVQDVIEDEQSPAHGFTTVIWRSLQEAPTCSEILQGWLQTLGAEQGDALSSSFDKLVAQLFSILEKRRCLFVLDGAEALLKRSDDIGTGEAEVYLPGCAAYAQLLRLFLQRRHRSCLLLTSRTRPMAFTQVDARKGACHALELSGLTPADGSALLAAHGIGGVPAIRQQLHHRYVGNPLLLIQTATLIHELFDGDGAAFLQEGIGFVGDIGSALAQQIAQLSLLEQQLLHCLAQAVQPLCRQILWQQLTPTPAKPIYFYALQHLQRNFLLQLTNGQVTLTELFAAYLAEHTPRLEAITLPAAERVVQSKVLTTDCTTTPLQTEAVFAIPR